MSSSSAPSPLSSSSSGDHNTKEKKGTPPPSVSSSTSKASTPTASSSGKKEKKELKFPWAKLKKMFYADPDFDKVDCMGKSDAQSHSIAANPYKSTACDRKLANTPDHLLSAKQLQRKRDAEDFKNYSIRAIARYDYNHTYGVIGPRKSFKKFLKRVKRHSKERNLWNPRSVFLNQVDREEAEDKQQDPKEIEIDTWRTENEEEFFYSSPVQ